MSYVLYYAPGAASLAVHWMLVELGVAFRTERLDLAAGDQRSQGFLQINPSGRVPALVIDGRVYTESAALLMLLAERHPEAGLAPAIDDSRRAAWLELTVYLANTLSPAMRDWFYADQDGEPADAAAIRRLAQRRIEGAWGRLSTLLGDGRPYLLGDLMTTADLLATMLMRWSRNMPRPATPWRHIGPYVVRMRARTAFQDVCDREGLTDWRND
ncbi:MAG: glutathione S-transferase family protein [Rhodospirillaceae bacterium]|nr:glutathione S-transferase family protein [Rhodospirillaceae bacterium]